MLDAAWESCVQAFLRATYDRSGSWSTVRGYENVLRHFFRLYHPAQATRRNVDDFLHLSLAPYISAPKPATRNRRLATLNSFYRFASSFLVSSPTSVRPVPLFAGQSPTAGIRHAKTPLAYRVFSTDELVRFFAAIPRDSLRGRRDYAIFATLWWTARRVSEVTNLLWGDLSSGEVIDPDGTKRATMLYKWHGKGMAEGAYDTAELPSRAYTAIMDWLQISGRLEDIEDDIPLFVALPPDGGGMPTDRWKPLSVAAVQVRLKKYCVAAGLDPRNYSPHSLRHSAARERFLVHADPRSVQHILRHQLLATTSRYLSVLVTPADPVSLLLEQKFGDLL